MSILGDECRADEIKAERDNLRVVIQTLHGAMKQRNPFDASQRTYSRIAKSITAAWAEWLRSECEWLEEERLWCITRRKIGREGRDEQSDRSMGVDSGGSKGMSTQEKIEAIVKRRDASALAFLYFPAPEDDESQRAEKLMKRLVADIDTLLGCINEMKGKE